MEHVYHVYILASRRRGAIYVGVTNDLSRRIWEHKELVGSKFVKTYGITRLVYYDSFDQIHDALACEKRLKRWRRSWKDTLIEQRNPAWDDLYETLHL